MPKPVEISYGWVKRNSKYQDTEFYSRLFYDPENGPFKVPHVRINTYKKLVPDAPKLYVYSKIRVLVCSTGKFQLQDLSQ